MEEIHLNILNLSLILLAAFLGGFLIKKIGYPAILGELIVGMLLGPAFLGILEYSESVKIISEIGIILLMVYIGMEINFQDFKKASWPGLLAAFGGFFVPFFLGYYAILWSGGTQLSALFVAIAIGVTSLATKSRILVDLKLLNTRIAYVLMAGALISDTLALVIFSGIINFSESSSINIVDLAIVLGKILGFFAITISIGIYVLPRVGKWIAASKANNSTLYFTLILIIAFGYCELAELAGMHSILGAFMAGLFINDNIFRKNISKELHKAFYDVSIGFMAPIFFVSAGFFVDLNVFTTDLKLLIIITTLAIVGKIFGTALFYLPSKNGWREGITIGTGMNGRGAVEIIIAEIGLGMGIIDQTIFSIMVFMAIFTTLTVPVLLKLTTNWLKKRNELVYMVPQDNILILGINPISLFIAKYLKKEKNILFIDSNIEMTSVAETNGYTSYHGSVLNKEFMTENIPNTISSFIGVTSNKDINIQGAMNAQQLFGISELSLIVNEKTEKQTEVMLKKNTIQSLLFHTNQINSWSQITSIEDQNISELTSEEEISTSDWIVKHQLDTEKELPLIIEDVSGHYRLFSNDQVILKNEKVISIKQ